jgi:hypothetical protein
MGVAIGRRVYDDLNALSAGQLAMIEPVLCADIGRWLRREFVAGQCFKLGAVVIGKKDIMMSQRKAVGLDVPKKSHCGE